jgi:hypothetical protein
MVEERTVIVLAAEQQPCMVGQFLDAIFRTTTNHRTVEGYAKTFRQIVSDIFGLSSGRHKESSKGSFVIQSQRPPLPVKPRQYYRCEPVFTDPEISRCIPFGRNTDRSWRAIMAFMRPPERFAMRICAPRPNTIATRPPGSLRAIGRLLQRWEENRDRDRSSRDCM